ncbi:MAG: hypothetical protein AAGA48_26990 [Myxococcota bacterium]
MAIFVLGSLVVTAVALHQGVRVRWALAMGVAFALAHPHMAMSTSDGLAALGLALAWRFRQTPWIAGLGAALALGSDLRVGVAALGVGLRFGGQDRWRFLGIAGLGFVGADRPAVKGLWPWTCAPRRLGTALPLSWAALGLTGMAAAVRHRPHDDTGMSAILTRVGPLVAGLGLGWLGTYHPPRPPLYNLPSAIALWSIGAGLFGAWIHGGRRTTPDQRAAFAIGIALLVGSGLRLQDLGPGPVCGQMLAMPAAIGVLALSLGALMERMICVLSPRWLDLVLVAHLIWMAGFIRAS